MFNVVGPLNETLAALIWSFVPPLLVGKMVKSKFTVPPLSASVPVLPVESVAIVPAPLPMLITPPLSEMLPNKSAAGGPVRPAVKVCPAEIGKGAVRPDAFKIRRARP